MFPAAAMTQSGKPRKSRPFSKFVVKDAGVARIVWCPPGAVLSAMAVRGRDGTATVA